MTEQDVINEEMYEEEDDDLPTQYQRLNAHLHTTSVMFNKKLHDYIATQHGVRNMFMSQYQNPSFQQYNGQFQPTAKYPQAQQNNWLNPSMMPPQQFNPSSPQQNVTQQSQPQHQNFRSSPYPVPQRVNSHQRSLSIQLPQGPSSFDPSSQSAPAGVTTPQDSFRRMSLPAAVDTQQRSSLSRTPTTRSHQSASPHSASPSITSGQVTPQLHNGEDSPAPFPFSAAGYPFSSQALNPLSMSMPAESQQFLGSSLDPNDPRTALFMAGSETLPQHFPPSYPYNPYMSGKASRPTSASGATTPGVAIKAENAGTPPGTVPSEGFFTNEAFLTPGNDNYNAFFDFGNAEYTQPLDDQGDGSNLINWD